MAIWSWLTRRRRDDEDLNDEIRAHLAIAAQEHMADGADPKAARQASLREFGNVTLTTEAARRVWTPRWVESVLNCVSDIRYAIRSLARNPLFALTVIAVLTLGIGLNAAVFTMLKSMAFSPIAGVDGSARLAVMFRETTAGRQLRVSYPDYRYLRDHDTSFQQLFGSNDVPLGLGRGLASRAVFGEIVTGNYFSALGVQPELGRLLQPTDELVPGGHPVVVISDGLWRRDYNADPAILGKTIELNHYPLTVVGVADRAFHGTTVVYDVEVFIPVMMAPALGVTFGSSMTAASDVLADRTTSFFVPSGFLRPGITIANAAARADALWRALAKERPLDSAAEKLKIARFWQSPDGAPTQVLPPLIVMSAMGCLVLLIACANLAGLVLVRGISRRGEIAMRLALGAPRLRIVRLLLIENLVLAIPGALLGVLVASRAVPLFVGYAQNLVAPQRLFFNIGVDGLVLAFAVVAACGSALACGLMPALQGSRIDLVTVMNDVSPRGAARGRMRSGLVVAQVAVSLLLLIGSGLVTRSLDALKSVNPGFDGSRVAGIKLDAKQDGLDESHGRAFYRRLLDAIRGDSGTDAASLAAFDPMAVIGVPAKRVALEGYNARVDEDLAFLFNVVGADYFRTLHIPLIAGREFAERDDASAAPVVVVNRTLADTFWGGPVNAVGKRLRAANGEWRTVIGVAQDVKYVQINESPRPYFYLPFEQSYRPNMIVYTTGSSPVDVLLGNARAHLAALDANLPVLSARPLADRINGATLFVRLTASMLFAFGITGLLLAALGTHGLVAYMVRQSTREIGIRMALGAQRLSVVRVFLERGLRLGAMGAALGFVTALAVTRLLGSAIYGVSPTDAVSFASALAVVTLGVVVATLVPAWRASRTDPLDALRHQ